MYLPHNQPLRHLIEIAAIVGIFAVRFDLPFHPHFNLFPFIHNFPGISHSLNYDRISRWGICRIELK